MTAIFCDMQAVYHAVTLETQNRESSNEAYCVCYSLDMHHLGMRHKHERRIGLKKTPQSRYIVFLDKLTFIAGVVGPFTVVPQIYTIFSTHSAQGVSLSTWALIFVVTLPWVFYGIAHKERSIIVSFILWEVANLLVVIGVLLYH